MSCSRLRRKEVSKVFVLEKSKKEVNITHIASIGEGLSAEVAVQPQLVVLLQVEGGTVAVGQWA